MFPLKKIAIPESGGARSPPGGGARPPGLRDALLDPASWRAVLETFARATHLAVALADADGRLHGDAINPRPTWALLHTTRGNAERRLPEGAGRPFSLAPTRPCSCVADALAGGNFRLAGGRAGLVHFAVPLVLAGHHLGALVAGPVSGLPARPSGTHLAWLAEPSPDLLWEPAGREPLVSHAVLRAQAEMLKTLGRTFLRTHYQALAGVRVNRRQEAPREGEDRLRLAVEAAALGTWDYDPATAALHWSDRCKELFGLAREAETDYETFLAALHPDDRQPADEAERRALDPAGDGRSDVEYRTVSLRDGVERWVRSTGRAFFRGGRAVRLVGTVQDVTDRKRAEIGLREADRRKDDFLATVAHELRNPLAAIRNAAHLIGLRGSDGAALESARDLIDRQVRRLARLVDDLLDVTRVRQGQVGLTLEAIDVAAAVTQDVETSRPLIEAHGHRLEVTLPGRAVLVQADADRLGQVVANLLSNAAKYTDRGGRRGPSSDRGSVDPGAGLRHRDPGGDAAARLRPVQPGAGLRGPLRGRTGHRPGTGATPVEAHGGSVTAGSEGHGKGSEFVVRLPVLREISVGTCDLAGGDGRAAETNQEGER